jgi:hypothetical protein
VTSRFKVAFEAPAGSPSRADRPSASSSTCSGGSVTPPILPRVCLSAWSPRTRGAPPQVRLSCRPGDWSDGSRANFELAGELGRSCQDEPSIQSSVTARLWGCSVAPASATAVFHCGHPSHTRAPPQVRLRRPQPGAKRGSRCRLTRPRVASLQQQQTGHRSAWQSLVTCGGLR